MEYIKKDITTVKRGVIAHGVNCKGVMGSGVAKAIRSKWPMVFENFSKWKPSKDLIGKCQFVPVDANIWVANCFTQIGYGRDPNVRYASPDAIRKSLREAFLMAHIEEKPLFMPKIGCGLGGLNWNIDVFPIVEDFEKEYGVDVYICDI